MEHETLFPLLCKTADGDKKAFAELYTVSYTHLTLPTILLV